MELNLNQNNASLREALNNSNFAQFLSEHLSQNNISQSEITYLLNLFSNHLNNQNNLSNSRNINLDNNNLNNSLRESQLSIASNNPSIISDSNILSDISEAPVNNGAAPGINHVYKKEYENGTYEGILLNNLRDGHGIMHYKNGD